MNSASIAATMANDSIWWTVTRPSLAVRTLRACGNPDAGRRRRAPAGAAGIPGVALRLSHADRRDDRVRRGAGGGIRVALKRAPGAPRHSHGLPALRLGRKHRATAWITCPEPCRSPLQLHHEDHTPAAHQVSRLPGQE